MRYRSFDPRRKWANQPCTISPIPVQWVPLVPLAGCGHYHGIHRVLNNTDPNWHKTYQYILRYRLKFIGNIACVLHNVYSGKSFSITNINGLCCCAINRNCHVRQSVHLVSWRRTLTSGHIAMVATMMCEDWRKSSGSYEKLYVLEQSYVYTLKIVLSDLLYQRNYGIVVKCCKLPC